MTWSAADLKKFFKIILVFFHGQADVERSFSFNKQFLVENLQEDSLIAQRSVHNFLEKLEKIKDVVITKDMILAFKSSSAGRIEALKTKQEQEDLLKKRKRELSFEIREVKSQQQEADEALIAAQNEIIACKKKLQKLTGEKK